MKFTSSGFGPAVPKFEQGAVDLLAQSVENIYTSLARGLPQQARGAVNIENYLIKQGLA